MKSLYEILGVSKNASDDDIKAAYRGLAKKYHPDRNPNDPKAEELFKEIQSAYHVLGDKEKRRDYDNPRGHSHQGFGGFGAHGRFSDIFSEMFGGSNPFTGGHQRRRSRPSSRGQKVLLTLEEAAFGCEKEVVRDYSTICSPCGGTGADASKGSSACGTCRGVGEVIAHKGFITVKQTCPTCHGTGRVVSHSCEHCSGAGRHTHSEKIRVHFPKGIATGNRIKLDGKGDEFLPGNFGDLYLDVHVLDSELFDRRGNDIYTKVHVDYPTMVLGGAVDVMSIRGKKKVKIPKMLNPGSKIRIKGEGVADVRTGEVGDQYVEVLLKFPDSLSGEMESLLIKMKELTR